MAWSVSVAGSRRDQEKVVELDPQENPGELKSREVELDPQETSGEIKRVQVISRAGRWNWTLKRVQERSRESSRDQEQGVGAGPSRESRGDQD